MLPYFWISASGISVPCWLNASTALRASSGANGQRSPLWMAEPQKTHGSTAAARTRPKSTEQAAKSRRIVVDVGRSGVVGALLVRRVRREHFKYVGVGAGLILC